MFTFFHPGKTFPAFSITGKGCELNCLHCNHHYLSAMVDVSDQDDLFGKLLKLSHEGGVGALISGGSDRGGVVPLAPFIPALKRIKEETDLVLNVHTGFIGGEDSEALAGAGVDVVSFDVVGSRETAQQVYGLNKGPADYRLTLSRLEDAGIASIVPHVTVGLHFGKLYGEYNAIRVISQACKADAVVINALIPTRNTGMGSVSVPSVSNVASIIEYAVAIMDAPVYLGCMRSKGNTELEIAAEEAGASGIVLPSSEGRKAIMGKRETEDLDCCCAVLPRKNHVVSMDLPE